MSRLTSGRYRRFLCRIDPRFYWSYNQKEQNDSRTEVEIEEEANLIGSQLVAGPEVAYSGPGIGIWAEEGDWVRHSPILDIDFEARLVPSSTEGHYHLYLDGLDISWAAYKKLLRALAEAGVIEGPYAELSISRGQTFALKEGVTKDDIHQEAQLLRYGPPVEEVEMLEFVDEPPF